MMNLKLTVAATLLTADEENEWLAWARKSALIDCIIEFTWRFIWSSLRMGLVTEDEFLLSGITGWARRVLS